MTYVTEKKRKFDAEIRVRCSATLRYNEVKRFRYKQDKERAALLQGVYIDVHDQNKT